LAVVKPHVIRFGKWTTVKWLAGADEDRPVDLKIRALYVDTRLKEYTTRAPPEVTDRLFLVQPVFPPERQLARRARWNASLAVAAGWMPSGRSGYRGPVAPIALPEFDPFYSSASWYRDYTAYCGGSDDGKKLFASSRSLEGANHPEENAGRSRGQRCARFTVFRTRLAAGADARDLYAEARAEGDVSPCEAGWSSS